MKTAHKLLTVVMIIMPMLYSCAVPEESETETQNAAPSSHVKTYTVAVGSSQFPYG